MAGYTRTIALLLLSLIRTTAGDGYGHGIAKNTYASSDPQSCHAWFASRLPVRCQDDFACNQTLRCGAAGRVAFCSSETIGTDGTCPMPPDGGPGHGPPGAGGPPGRGRRLREEQRPQRSSPRRADLGGISSIFGGGPPPGGGSGGDFGLHTVNTSARPGHAELLRVETEFAKRFAAAVEENRYDPFLDFATVVFAPGGLDRYVRRFLEAGDPFLTLRWSDDSFPAPTTYYSLLVRPCGQVVLEIVSDAPPDEELWVGYFKAPSFVADDVVRLPASVFLTTEAKDKHPLALVPLAVSKGMTDPNAVQEFYVSGLRATQTLSQVSADSKSLCRTYRLSNADAVVRFISRPEHQDFDSSESESESAPNSSSSSSSSTTTTSPSSAPAPIASVAELEAVKHGVRREYYVDRFCGVDKFLDNHFAWDQFDIDLNDLSDYFDAHAAAVVPGGRSATHLYHVFGDGDVMMGPQRGAPTNMYVTDPTGDSIQVDGRWSSVPTGGSGDSLMAPCGQGNCCGKGALFAVKPGEEGSDTPSRPYVKVADSPEAEVSRAAAAAAANCSAALEAVLGGLSANPQHATGAAAAAAAASADEPLPTKCADAAYSAEGWAALKAASCTNADVYNYCADVAEACLPKSLLDRIKSALPMLLPLLFACCCCWGCGGLLVARFWRRLMSFWRPVEVVDGSEEDDDTAEVIDENDIGSVELTEIGPAGVRISGTVAGSATETFNALAASAATAAERVRQPIRATGGVRPPAGAQGGVYLPVAMSPGGLESDDE
jgi:hypothetical protein